MHEKDKRRVSSQTRKPAAQKKQEQDFTEHKSFKFFMSKKFSFILGLLFLITGLFACIDYFGPKKTSREIILGFPNAGNIPLIRTTQSYFVIDIRLRYEHTSMHNILIDVDKSTITHTPLSFSLPDKAPGEKYYPLNTRYDYIWLFALCIVSGITLIFYPKKNYGKMYFIVFSIIIFIGAIISAVGMQININSIYSIHTMNW